MLPLYTKANVTYGQKAFENMGTHCHIGTKYLSVKITGNDL